MSLVSPYFNWGFFHLTSEHILAYKLIENYVRHMNNNCAFMNYDEDDEEEKEAAAAAPLRFCRNFDEVLCDIHVTFQLYNTLPVPFVPKHEIY